MSKSTSVGVYCNYKLSIMRVKIFSRVAEPFSMSISNIWALELVCKPPNNGYCHCSCCFGFWFACLLVCLFVYWQSRFHLLLFFFTILLNLFFDNFIHLWKVFWYFPHIYPISYPHHIYWLCFCKNLPHLCLLLAFWPTGLSQHYLYNNRFRTIHWISVGSHMGT